MNLAHYAAQYELSLVDVCQVAHHINPNKYPQHFERELESMRVINNETLDYLFMEQVTDYCAKMFTKQVDVLSA